MNITENSKPLVSVIVNCHNGEAFLQNCISSIINQTYSNWEVIFWDNLSSDKSKEILLNFSDQRIKYFYSDKFTTLYEARNLALKKASGEFITFLDVDDWWSPFRLEKQIKIFLDKKNLDIVYSNHYIFYDDKKTKKIIPKDQLPSGKITQKLLDSYKIGGILTALLKKQIFKKRIFDKRYEIIGDFDFFINISLNSYFQSIEEPLAYYRIHKSSTSSKKINLQIKELNNWLEENKNSIKFKGYHFDGVIFTLQCLKIKKSLLDGKRLEALLEIVKFPFKIQKLKFLVFLFIPINGFFKTL